MTKEEMRFQVAISCIQGVLEAKHGIIGEIVPAIAVKESLRIADEFVKQWTEEGNLLKDVASSVLDKLHEIEKNCSKDVQEKIDEIKNLLEQ